MSIAYTTGMALKVFDLACDSGHVFEGWFSSREEFDRQCEHGLLCCPVCDSKAVTRRVSASRLNVSGATRAPQAAASQPALTPEAQADALRRLRDWVRSTENVGAGFAAEARRIHEGESPERPIRGTASPDERQALVEDGIAVMPLPSILDDDQLQ